MSFQIRLMTPCPLSASRDAKRASHTTVIPIESTVEARSSCEAKSSRRAPGCFRRNQQFQYPAQYLEISHNEGGACGARPDMDRPCIARQALEELFVSAIIAGRENEIGIRRFP